MRSFDKFGWMFVGAILLVMVLCSFNLVSAKDNIGTFEKDSCVNLVQVCSDCSYVNFTSLIFPNSTIVYYDAAMVNVSNVFSYETCNTSLVGEYIVAGFGDPSGVVTSWNYYFDVVGSDQFVSSDGVWFFGLICLVAVLGGLCLLMGKFFDSVVFSFVGSIIISLCGLYLVIYGVHGVDNVLLVSGVGWCCTLLGCYLLVRVGLEYMEQQENYE